jgi:ferredoxin
MKRQLVQPSTRALLREARRTPGYTLLDLLHGYVYARWVYYYISIGSGQHWLGRLLKPVVEWIARLIPTHPPEGASGTVADVCHGKVVPLEAASQLVNVQQDVSLTNLEHVIPYVYARDIVLQNPDHIIVLQCPCRSMRPHPCLPLDVCLVVGEPFASFVAEHHPRRSRWITSQEAVEILQAEDERGHVHSAFFKDAMLGRFYAICNCCACCCGAIGLRHEGIPMLASSGYVAQPQAELCIGCGVCVDACQFHALALDDDLISVNYDACMGCGVCVAQCAQGTLSLARDPAKGEPLEIYKLMELAASS